MDFRSSRPYDASDHQQGAACGDHRSIEVGVHGEHVRIDTPRVQWSHNSGMRAYLEGVPGEPWSFRHGDGHPSAIAAQTSTISWRQWERESRLQLWSIVIRSRLEPTSGISNLTAFLKQNANHFNLPERPCHNKSSARNPSMRSPSTDGRWHWHCSSGAFPSPSLRRSLVLERTRDCRQAR